jgi:hypothetical protein
MELKPSTEPTLQSSREDDHAKIFQLLCGKQKFADIFSSFYPAVFYYKSVAL